MKFKVENPNHQLSPYTGMDRTHWLQVSKFYLEGIFNHVKQLEDPIIVPKHDENVGYPTPDTPEWRLSAERFEGLARSFLIGAPLLKNEPDVVISGHSLLTYYKNHILWGATKGHPLYLLDVEEIRKTADPRHRAYQHTCECASLVIGLYMCKEVLWDTYTKEEKDIIAAYLSHFGHSETGHHNWRLFNMLILGFLHQEGYTIDQGMMRDHASCILSYYAGDGWYRDGHLFDYYCPWAFHVYGPLWNMWYGYENEPYMAKKIEEYVHLFVETYPAFFDAQAQVTMWGRSSIYRSAAAAPLAADLLLPNTKMNPGLARRIASGSLLQFATREECFYEGVPSLGFYGPFTPLVQSYSCAASPFWLANTFLCLYLPADHPFWCEKEENGVWETGSNGHTVIDAPGIVLDNHVENGYTEFRTAKVLMGLDHTSRNAYSRVAFHSNYPWENFAEKGVEAMQYSLKYDGQEVGHTPNVMLYGGEKEGVLYRKQYFQFVSTFQDEASMDLADFAVPFGHLRVDKMRIPKQPYTVTLGAYGMPDKGEVVTTFRKELAGGLGAEAVIVAGEHGTVALVTYHGWEGLGVEKRVGTNPVLENSVLGFAKTSRKVQYAYAPYTLISAVLTKPAGEEWSEEELFPVASIQFTDPEKCGGYGPIEVVLKNGQQYTVDFEGMEGKLVL